MIEDENVSEILMLFSDIRNLEFKTSGAEFFN